MKLFVIAILFAFSSNAEPVLEFSSPNSALCENRGAATECPTGANLQFSDDQSCACLKDGQFTHPIKCMIGPMRCDSNLGQRYSWLHRFEDSNGRQTEVATGCACVISKQ